MSRLLYSDLDPEDVLLADQAYGNYVDLAWVQRQEPMLFSQAPCASNRFSPGKKLGIGDHQVVWHKPKPCPKHECSEFAALPTT